MQYNINILMIEDNECDIEVVEGAITRLDYPITLHVVKSAEEAIDFLHKRGEYTNQKTPNLIFLDLNLPNMSGIEFLDTINLDDQIRMIPVIIITTSDNHQDIINTYQRCISWYVTKPLDINEFENIIRGLTNI